MSRLSGLGRERFDLAVVGGGIIGCGIARDAALRGLRVALFEKRDFASGTTSASTRIVHGGLRYLEMLDFRLVRLDLRERQRLLRIASHLVAPLEFLIPFFAGDAGTSLKMRAGLAMYDALSFDGTLPGHRWLNAAEARAADDALARQGVRSAAAYHDARVDSPERLALENVLDAERAGARAFNYCEVTGTIINQGRLEGLRVRDGLDGAELDVSSSVVVNATGAWFPFASDALSGRRPPAIRTTKGIHIVCPPLTRRALVIFSRVDRRLVFAIPRAGLTWLGTTDTDYSGDPADVRATGADVDYLIASVRHVFPALARRDVLYTTAGVRALVRRSGAETSVSRMHKIVDGEPIAPNGIVSVLGGKITGYRAIAEETVDIVCRKLGIRGRSSTTAETPLPGAGPSSDDLRETARPSMAAHLRALYGSRAADVLGLARSAPELEKPLSAGYPDIGAQVVFALRHEHVVRLSDFLKRRTLLGASADQGWDAAAPAAALMAAELGWSTSRVAEELVGYRRELAVAQAFREDS